jgi:hypothetical protein
MKWTERQLSTKATSSRGRFSGTRVRYLKEKPNLVEGKGASAWEATERHHRTGASREALRRRAGVNMAAASKVLRK